MSLSFRALPGHDSACSGAYSDVGLNVPRTVSERFGKGSWTGLARGIGINFNFTTLPIHSHGQRTIQNGITPWL
jgi:hypothetical protein